MWRVTRRIKYSARGVLRGLSCGERLGRSAVAHAALEAAQRLGGVAEHFLEAAVHVAHLMDQVLGDGVHEAEGGGVVRVHELLERGVV